MIEIQCKNCGKKKEQHNFYKYQDGSCDTICKSCITSLLNIDDFCKRYDIPFLLYCFSKILYNKSKKLITSNYNFSLKQSVFGTYYNTMKLAGYRNFRYKDTEELNARIELTDNDKFILKMGELL